MTRFNPKILFYPKPEYLMEPDLSKTTLDAMASHEFLNILEI